MVRVLNLFTGEGRRTPLMPRKVVPEKHSWLLSSNFSLPVLFNKLIGVLEYKRKVETMMTRYVYKNNSSYS